jgi:hypothetical protein
MMMKIATGLLFLALLMLTSCPSKMADTTPPDLTKMGFTQQNNPDLRSPEVTRYLNSISLLGPQASLTVKAVQELNECLVESKAAQWAIYTDQKNRLTVGLVFKASKNGLTNPNTWLGCVSRKLSSGPQAAQYQLCSGIGQYADSATGDTVYTGYIADDSTLCSAIIGSLPQLQRP